MLTCSLLQLINKISVEKQTLYFVHVNYLSSKLGESQNLAEFTSSILTFTNLVQAKVKVYPLKLNTMFNNLMEHKTRVLICLFGPS